MEGKEGLQAHEWLFVLLLIAALFCTLTAALLAGKGEPAQAGLFFSAEKKVEVLLKGAVEQAGIYKITPNMLLKELLQIAGVLPEADLRRLKLNRPIAHTRILNIRKREMISIYLEGAVRNVGVLTVPRGSILSDLQQFVVFDQKADTTFLNKKRRLKDGEVIKVPFE